LALAVHEGRLAMRRGRRSKTQPTATVAGMLVVATLLTPTAGCVPIGVSSDGAYEARLVVQKDKLRDELKQLNEKAGQLAADRKRIDTQISSERDRILKSWVNLLGGNNDTVAKDFRHQEEDAAGKLREAMQYATIADKIGDSGTKAIAQLQADRIKLAEMVKQAKTRQSTGGAVLIGACAAFALLGYLPLTMARGRIRKQRRKEAGTCPRCLATDKLEVRRSDTQDDRYPEPAHVVCGSCNYKFRASYRKLPRLCFPTVGVRSSGKTHWLVTAYDMIRNNNVPVAASFKKAPSLADEQFDALMDMLLKAHLGPQATTHTALPDPLNFYARDTDPWGRNAAMLNLFDFSGELMNQSIDTNLLRRRALLMDGFALFLDPTQLYGRGNDESIDTQIRQVNQFYEDMRDMRGLDVGAVIPVPIAVCVSKMDLLVTDNPLGGQARPFLRELRATLGQPVTRELVRYRSQICESMLPVMFQGWDIRRTLRECFGGQVMFFPLTPVGLEEGELGVKDLTRRTIAPFGILEPVLWLAHMHGYSILD
jgi:hypothetical protein